MANPIGKDLSESASRSRGQLCIWSDAPLGEWLMQGIRSSGVEVIAVGSPRSEVRSCFGHDYDSFSDLRIFSGAMRGIPMLFVGFGNAAARTAIASNNPIIFTTEPWLGNFAGIAKDICEVPLPGFPLDGRFAQATDIFAQSGSPDITQITSLGSVEHGSILARIQEAASLLLRWMGVPDRVSASVGGAQIQRTCDEYPDSASRSFRTWIGSFALTCQFSDGRAGLIMASNQHPAWSRSASACGQCGAVRVDDVTLDWRDASNNLIERTVQNPSEWESSDHVSLIAHTLRSSANELLLGRQQHSLSRAFVEAACLSVFTLESESPFKMAEIFGEG